MRLFKAIWKIIDALWTAILATASDEPERFVRNYQIERSKRCQN